MLISKFIRILFFFNMAFFSSCLGAEKAEDTGQFTVNPQVERYFEEDRQIMSEALKNFKAAELHFFWATGYDPNTLKNEYGANLQVDVGGKRHAAAFQQYVGWLLQCSPDHLKIKVVCDVMTYNSNQEWLEGIQSQYGGRFQVLDIIENVLTNLLQVFPDHQDILKRIFLNATRGIPVIPSDAYRLVAMIYGTTPNPDLDTIENTQYTYCDVDTFCFGMGEPNQKECVSACFEEGGIKFTYVLRDVPGHSNLIKALFEPLQPEMPKSSLFAGAPPDPYASFHIGRKKNESNGNDLIKLRVYKLDSYHLFCCKALYAMQQEDKSVKGVTLMTYFPRLHDHISQVEQKPQQAFEAYLKDFFSFSINIGDIMHVTGPGLVDKLYGCFPLPQDYPDMNAMEWHRTHYLGRGYHDPLAMFSDSQGLKKAILEHFSRYAQRISDAFYALRFGKDHPFNIQMKKYLEANFPYSTTDFKFFMKQLYNDEHKGVAMEVWLDGAVTKLKGKEINEKTDGALCDASYYIRLNHALQQLGINRPLILEDIDFRGNDGPIAI